MMRKALLMLSTTSLLAVVSTAAYAQDERSPDPAVQAQAENDEGIAAGEIVVTARRKAESLQDVPQSITALSSDTLEKLNITRLDDINQVVPGLTISNGGFTIRGVNFNILNAGSPTIQFYLNDAPVPFSSGALNSTFDIGQVEVLRGPQGTLRGKSAPSGAITVTTRRPSLTETGGYVYGTVSDNGGWMTQGAVSVPIVSNVLALRVAGLVERRVPDVRSINSPVDPIRQTEALRATLRFEPTPNFAATLMYQYTRERGTYFPQVAGTGGGANPANPVILPSDRLSVIDFPEISYSAVHLGTAQFDWEFSGQKLSYVGSIRLPGYGARGLNTTSQDAANVIPGFDFYSYNYGGPKDLTQELRLSSMDRVAGMFDYTIGAFYSHSRGLQQFTFPVVALAGAYGAPGTPAAAGPGPINSRYLINTLLSTSPDEKELAFFGNVTAHFGTRTELSAGLRYIQFNRNFPVTISTLDAYNALSPATCPFVPTAVPSPVYPGGCDLLIPGSLVSSVNPAPRDRPLLYNVSLTHRFSDDFMAYATVGSAYRVGGFSIGTQGSYTCCGGGNPDLVDLAEYVLNPAERSTNYEVGFKSTFFDKRLRFNVAVFHQKLKNYSFYGYPAAYLQVTDPNGTLTAPNATVGTFTFSSAVPATVTGFEIEAAFQVTPRFNLGLGFSYSKGKLGNGRLPCSDNDFDGIPNRLDGDFVPGTPLPSVGDFVSRGIMLATCPTSGESISSSADWNLTAQGEYSVPLSSEIDAFIRGNLTYSPDNPNRSEFIVIDKYMVLNMFAGVRSTDGTWELSAFAKGVNNPDQILSRGGNMVRSGVGLNDVNPSNYYPVSYTARREFGLSLRYAFGSR